MPLMETLQDDFSTSGAPNATRWPVVQSGATVTGGVLQITDSSGAYPVVQSAASYTIQGSSLIAKVVTATPAGGSLSAQTYMSVNFDDNNWVGIYRDGNNLYRLIKTGGTDASTLIGTYNATNMAWWRIRVSGTTWFTAYSADGSTWTEQSGFTTTFSAASTTMRAGFMVGKWATGDPNPVGTFDDVNLPPSGSTPKSGSDTASGVDNAGQVSQTSTDTGTGVDNAGQVAQASADTTTGVDDAGSVLQTETKSGSDTGTAVDEVSGRSSADTDTVAASDTDTARTVAGADTAAGAEAEAVRELKSGTDTGTGVDNAGTIVQVFAGADPPTTTETVTGRTLSGGASTADTVTVTEDGSVANLAPVLKSGSDTVSSSEGQTRLMPGSFTQIPAPKDWANGDMLDAGTLNKEWRDTFKWLLRETIPGISVYNSDGVSLTYTSNVAIPLKTETTKRGNLTHATNDTKVYVWEPGWYVGIVQLGATLTSVSAGATSLASVVKVNGLVTSTNESPRVTGSLWCVGHLFNVYMNPGDYVEIALGGTWTGTATGNTLEYTWPRLELFWRSHWDT